MSVLLVGVEENSARYDPPRQDSILKLLRNEFVRLCRGGPILPVI